MSGAEGQDLAGTDPIDLQLPRGATSSGTPNVNALSNTFDRHEEFVANDARSWTLGKFSWLEMVLLDCHASNQQTTF